MSLTRRLVAGVGLRGAVAMAKPYVLKAAASAIGSQAVRVSSRGLHYGVAHTPDRDIMDLMEQHKTDVLVLGLRVAVLTSADDPRDCNSYWAQGGIIYKAEDDSPSLLTQDIMSAGAGINDKKAVRKLAVDGPSCVEDVLINKAKVPFDRRKEDGRLALCLEASHNRARIIHWRDHTGRAITESLLKTVYDHPDILLLSGLNAVELASSQEGGVCVGAHVLRNGEGGRVFPIRAGATVLATGGLGELYEHTSNPPSARGDGFALAYRAGAALQNMEYVQFHPTTLFLPGERSFLLTEALRGEGAKLVNIRGEAFAKRYHAMGELAPRDIVSRMIVSEMEETGADHVYLDISHRDGGWIKNRFPAIYKHCLKRGLDMTKQPLPVVPAAHYFCGGVATDLNGMSTLPGLFAVGEVACTGLHGANRLASTSLLEGVVWGVAIANYLREEQARGKVARRYKLAREARLNPLDRVGALPADKAVVEDFMAKIRRVMWEKVGVVRSKAGLEEADMTVRAMEKSIMAYMHRVQLSRETISLRNAIVTSRLIAKAALQNDRSVGAHYVVDGLDEEEEQQMMANHRLMVSGQRKAAA